MIIGIHKLSAGRLARVMRSVLTGHRQAIMVTPTNEDIKAAQGYQRLAITVLSADISTRESPGKGVDTGMTSKLNPQMSTELAADEAMTTVGSKEDKARDKSHEPGRETHASNKESPLAI